MNIIGQEQLVNLIDSKTRSTFPRSVILLGPKGCGKHLISNYIAEKLDYTLVDITDKLSFEFINSLYLKPEPYIYTIEIKNISIREQNMILKFLEEPLKNSYIILLAETKNQMLDTIVNRCQLWTFKPYSVELLKELTCNDTILRIARTPGLLLELETVDIDEIVTLCNKIIESIDKASVPNILTISDKLAFKQEKDKIDIDVFAEVLLYQANLYVKEIPEARYLTVYKNINRWYNERKVPNVNQKYLFDRFILSMQQELRQNDVRRV